MTKNLKQRKITHRYNTNNQNSQKYNRKLYKYIRENELDFNNLTFKVLKDNLPDKQTAEKYETTFIIFYNSICNGTNNYYSAFTDIRNREYKKSDKYKDYQQDYKKTDKYKDYQKDYRKINKHIINEKNNCPLCNLQMNKRSLKEHIRRKHK